MSFDEWLSHPHLQSHEEVDADYYDSCVNKATLRQVLKDVRTSSGINDEQAYLLVHSFKGCLPADIYHDMVECGLGEWNDMCSSVDIHQWVYRLMMIHRDIMDKRYRDGLA